MDTNPMKDAFGVEKSLVAPGKWKAAKDLTTAERVVVRNAKLHRSARFPPKDDYSPPKTSPLFRRAIHQNEVHRVLGQHSKDRFYLLSRKDERKLVHRSQLTPISKVLVEVEGGWVVQSEKGKRLSRPASREQALKRLRQIEYFKCRKS